MGAVTLGVDLGAPTAALRVSATELALAGGLTVTADGGIDANGQWSGSVTLGPSGRPGPAGSPQLRISAGPSGAAVGLHLGGLAQADLSLWPLPSGSSVAGLLPAAAAMFAGMLARDLIGAVRDLDQARLDPVLDFLGLLDGSGATATVRLPTGLVADPAGWLGRALAGQGLDPDRVASLVERRPGARRAARRRARHAAAAARRRAHRGAGRRGRPRRHARGHRGRRRPARGVQRRADHPLRRRAAGASPHGGRRASGRDSGAAARPDRVRPDRGAGVRQREHRPALPVRAGPGIAHLGRRHRRAAARP